ncbi:recombinase family protein [Streptomyces sp. NPDC004126]|uniref:recombinase family protein n=1 Tax=Streptomyces sp. NPDC004126 TaxID=3390695 RepID=UPI003CFDA2EE
MTVAKATGDLRLRRVLRNRYGSTHGANRPGGQGVRHGPGRHVRAPEPQERDRQPGFERLMEDARAGKFDVVVIYMLSRLTRQGAAEALKIQQELAKCGVAIVSTQEPFINTSDDNPSDAAGESRRGIGEGT